MATKKSTQSVEILGLKETLRANSKLGKNAQRALKAAARQIADATARQAASKATSVGAMQGLVGDSIRAGSDRVPVVRMGGAKRVGVHRHPVGAFAFGAEFGGGVRSTTHQFLPHLGRTGYFLWPTIRERKPNDLAIYHMFFNAIVREWGG